MVTRFLSALRPLSDNVTAAMPAAFSALPESQIMEWVTAPVYNYIQDEWYDEIPKTMVRTFNQVTQPWFSPNAAPQTQLSPNDMQQLNQLVQQYGAAMVQKRTSFDSQTDTAPKTQVQWQVPGKVAPSPQPLLQKS